MASELRWRLRMEGQMLTVLTRGRIRRDATFLLLLVGENRLFASKIQTLGFGVLIAAAVVDRAGLTDRLHGLTRPPRNFCYLR